MKICTLKPFLFLIAACCALALPAGAHGRTQATPAQFFESIPDLPLMPGLEELEDQTLIFDKPAGRIVETLARAQQDVSVEQVQAYYAAALPAFGWTKISGRAYRRGIERLHLNFESGGEVLFLRINLSPQN